MKIFNRSRRRRRRRKKYFFSSVSLPIVSIARDCYLFYFPFHSLSLSHTHTIIGEDGGRVRNRLSNINFSLCLALDCQVMMMMIIVCNEKVIGKMKIVLQATGLLSRYVIVNDRGRIFVCLIYACACDTKKTKEIMIGSLKNKIQL